MYAQRHVAGNRTHLNYYRNVKIHTNFKRSFISECTYKFLIDSLSLSLSFEKFTKYGIAKHLQRNTFNSDANSFHLHYENLFRTKMLSAKNAFRYVICVICFLRETTTKKKSMVVGLVLWCKTNKRMHCETKSRNMEIG